MRGLVAALLFMTRWPLPAWVAKRADFARLMPWLPATGLFVGFPVAIAAMAIAPYDAWSAALFALLAWILVTGALHIDGLADVVDGLGAAHGGQERLSRVMADPHVGSFGVVAIVAQLATKLVLLHAVITAGDWLSLAVIPLAARVGPLVWTLSLPPLHAGLAALLRDGMQRWHVLLWLGLVGLLAFRVPSLLGLLPALVAWHIFVARKLGGISGDSHGAGIELCESWLLICLVVAGWTG